MARVSLFTINNISTVLSVPLLFVLVEDQAESSGWIDTAQGRDEEDEEMDDDEDESSTYFQSGGGGRGRGGAKRKKGGYSRKPKRKRGSYQNQASSAKG